MGMLKRPQTRSPARQALADAIARRAEVSARRAAVSSALSQAEAPWHIESDLEAAKKRLEEAKGQATESAIAAASVGAPGERVSLREARVAVLDLEDALDVARATRKRLDAEIQRDTEALPASRVREAARAVIAGEGTDLAKRLAREAAEAHKVFLARASMLEWLIQRGALGRDESFRGDHIKPANEEAARVSLIYRDVLQATNRNWYLDEDSLFSGATVERQLEVDPDAPLPTGGV